MAIRSKAIVQASDADVQVKVGTGHYYGCTFLPVADGTCKIYDSASVAAVADSKLIAVLGGDAVATNPSVGENLAHPVRFTSGLTIVITGAGSLATIRYT
jgi:hypothetical protein